MIVHEVRVTHKYADDTVGFSTQLFATRAGANRYIDYYIKRNAPCIIDLQEKKVQDNVFYPDR